MTHRISEGFSEFIIREQHGFVKKRSTLTNLVIYTDFISEALNDYNQVDSLYLDFSKAFDSVDHSILLYKLRNMGMSGGILRWLSSYLCNRELSVKIFGYKSRSFIATSGVPQGSDLGPLLFILFIIYIKQNISNSRFVVYADDIKLFHRINSKNDSDSLKDDLSNIFHWSIVNRLPFNVDKCK